MLYIKDSSQILYWEKRIIGGIYFTVVLNRFLEETLGVTKVSVSSIQVSLL